MTTHDKRFVDSSVVQPLLLGSRAYKAYFEEQFKDESIYVSDYVQMEIKRSCIAPFIHFYFVLTMPTVDSIGDALSVWSNRFRGREIKAVMRLIGKFIDTHSINKADPKNKKKTLRRLGYLIKRIESKSRNQFKNIGSNRTGCTRAKIHFMPPQVQEFATSKQFEIFIEKFDDTKNCRTKCRIDKFFLNRFKKEVDYFIEYAENLDRPNSKENKGFVSIVENLQKIKETGKISCYMCGKIGDAVIALEMPDNMSLEHTDLSFDNLCVVLSKAHTRHQSEIEIHKN